MPTQQINAPEQAVPTLFAGAMWNGRIEPTVSAGGITVTLKTAAGNDPSQDDKVYIRIGNTVRTISSALSVSKPSGTNWCNSGSSELSTKEIDYFVYLVWNTTPNPDVVDIGFSRIPYGNVYGDFSSTGTDEKFLAHANGSDPLSADDVVNIGRFAATLSATPFVWSVPTFTSTNLKQRPTYETRPLNWTPTYSGSGLLTYTSVTTLIARYVLRERKTEIEVDATGTLGGTADSRVGFTLPFEGVNAGVSPPPIIGAGWNGNANKMCVCFILPATPDLGGLFNFDLSNWANSGEANIRATGFYEI